MAKFKEVVMVQLKLLFFTFLLGSGFEAVPANDPANSCGSDFYSRLHITHSSFVYESFAAAILLLAVLTAINLAEAGTVAAACAAASGRGEAFDANKEVAAVAARGIATVPAGWKRGSLRALLCIAVHLTGVASLHAILAFVDGFLCRTGWHNGYTGLSPFKHIIMCLMVVVQSFSVWDVAKSKN